MKMKYAVFSIALMIPTVSLCAYNGYDDSELNIYIGKNGVRIGQPQQTVNEQWVRKAPKFRWVRSEMDYIPSNAVVGGYEQNRTLYICKAPYGNGMHPGKVVDDNCDIGYGGQEIVIPSGDYQILTGSGFSWVKARNGMLPNNAVSGGHENGRPLYICRVNYIGGKHPGKIVGRFCNFSYGGKEIIRPNYEVLVHPRA